MRECIGPPSYPLRVPKKREGVDWAKYPGLYIATNLIPRAKCKGGIMGEYYIQQLYYGTIVSLLINIVPAIAIALYWWREDRKHTARARSVTGTATAPFPSQDIEERRAA